MSLWLALLFRVFKQFRQVRRHPQKRLQLLVLPHEPWVAVDPKVVAGDVEWGIAQLVWTRLEDIEAQGGLDRHFPRLVEAAALDLERARAWTLVRCVDYWLWGLGVGFTEDPARCERIVRWLLAPSA